MILYILIFFTACNTLCARDTLNMQVTAGKHAKMKLLISIPRQASQELEEIAAALTKDFSFSEQFEVKVAHIDVPPSEKEIRSWSLKGFPLMVYVSATQKALEWRLYNTIGGKMLAGKKLRKRGHLVRGWAHNIADQVWPELTAQPGFFSSRIAYCKQVDRADQQSYKHVYIADYDGSHEELLVETPTVNVGARFHTGQQNCLIFYSQFTDKNIELRVADMNKKTRKVSVFDGVNMLPSFSEDGKKVAYCASKGTGNCQIYYVEGNKVMQITDNKANNISPTLSADAKKIYFCSDIKRVPSIYCVDREAQTIERLTSDASSMSPMYCAKRNSLAYCKKTDGVYQVFIYDCQEKEHRQVTFGGGHKSECSWSPCGNYILYAVEKDQKQYLETVTILSGTIRRLTMKGNCSYPSWSQCYRQFPTLT